MGTATAMATSMATATAMATVMAMATATATGKHGDNSEDALSTTEPNFIWLSEECCHFVGSGCEGSLIQTLYSLRTLERINLINIH